MRYRWHLTTSEPHLIRQLAGALNITERLAQCLANRGIKDPEAARCFLKPQLRQLSDPFLLPQMDRAVERLMMARTRGESVVIFGDFDVDGISSTALLVDVLTALGWQVKTYLPHRLEEGYGLSREAAENCLQRYPARLVLAVDCGSTAVETIRWLASCGVDVIVLDHHQVSDPVPGAWALVNPKLIPALDGFEGTEPPYSDLCSVGLAFKLAHALVKQGRVTGVQEAEGYDLRPLLDLVALGTVADLVSLTGENRILVSAGLDRLSRTRRPGLQALKQVAQCVAEVGVREVGFQLGPRLNAAGRLEAAEAALNLLLTDAPEEALALAQSLDDRNRERQQIERSIADEIIGELRQRFDPARDYVIVEGRPSWHLGVVGIVASRVLRTFHRPTIILGGDGEEWRGSGRSVEGFNLAAALRGCHDLLVRHGGHAMAAGLTLRPEKIDSFRERLNELARASLRPDQLHPSLRLDGELLLPELTVEAVELFARLGPSGMGNPPVQWMALGLKNHSPPQRMGRDQQHARLKVTDGRSVLDAIIWNVEADSLPGGSFDLAFTPQVNEYNGRRSVQLKVLDWRPTTASKGSS